MQALYHAYKVNFDINFVNRVYYTCTMNVLYLGMLILYMRVYYIITLSMCVHGRGGSLRNRCHATS